MNIPIGVNHLQFLEQCNKQGVVVNSKFKGVCFNLHGKAPCWIARVQGGGKLLAWKRFPFTEKGETEASKWYEYKKAQLFKNEQTQ